VDNVTHSLAGMLVAETALCWLPARAGRLRLAAYATSIIANNAPDLDFVYLGITGGPLGYVLHHRGHTHTLVLVIPMALLTLGILKGAAHLRALARRSEPSGAAALEPDESPRTRVRDRLFLMGLALAGPVLHLLMDLGNNYGTHPFWPFHNRWYYGDAIFIIEPLLFACAIPPLIAAARSRAARGVLAVILALILAACWLLPLVPVWVAAMVTAVAALAAGVGFKTGPRVRALFAVGAWVFVSLTFVLFSARMERRLSTLLAQEFPGATTLDLVVTPLPANPLCYGVLAVQRAGLDYVVRRLTVATAPSLLAASECPRLEDDPTAPLVSVDRPDTTEVVYRGQFSAPARELVELSRWCQARAFLRFSRVPYWTQDQEPGTILGDLRYDRTPGLDFADLRVLPEPCPRWVPGWVPPRQDVIGPSAH